MPKSSVSARVSLCLSTMSPCELIPPLPAIELLLSDVRGSEDIYLGVSLLTVVLSLVGVTFLFPLIRAECQLNKAMGSGMIVALVFV